MAELADHTACNLVLIENEEEISRLRAALEHSKQVPVGSKREHLYRTAQLHKRSRAWRLVWHLLKALDAMEQERDALKEQLKQVTR